MKNAPVDLSNDDNESVEIVESSSQPRSYKGWVERAAKGETNDGHIRKAAKTTSVDITSLSGPKKKVNAVNREIIITRLQSVKRGAFILQKTYFANENKAVMQQLDEIWTAAARLLSKYIELKDMESEDEVDKTDIEKLGKLETELSKIEENNRTDIKEELRGDKHTTENLCMKCLAIS